MREGIAFLATLSIETFQVKISKPKTVTQIFGKPRNNPLKRKYDSNVVHRQLDSNHKD